MLNNNASYYDPLYCPVYFNAVLSQKVSGSTESCTSVPNSFSAAYTGRLSEFYMISPGTSDSVTALWVIKDVKPLPPPTVCIVLVRCNTPSSPAVY